MNKKLSIMLLPAFVVLLPMGISFAQDIEPIEFPSMPGDASEADTPKVGAIVYSVRNMARPIMAIVGGIV